LLLAHIETKQCRKLFTRPSLKPFSSLGDGDFRWLYANETSLVEPVAVEGLAPLSSGSSDWDRRFTPIALLKREARERFRPVASEDQPHPAIQLNPRQNRVTHNRRVKRRAKRFRGCRLLAAALSFAGKDAPAMMDGLGGG
jgi:hypothetical protein